MVAPIAIAGSAALGTAVTSVAAPTFGPIALLAQQIAWGQKPIQIPDPHSLLVGYYAGTISQEQARVGLLGHGILWHPDLKTAGEDPLTQVWHGVGRAMLKVPSVEAAISAYTRGLINAFQKDDLVRRAGADPRMWDWVENLNYSVPSAELATAAYAREAIDGAKWLDLVRRSGGIENWWNEALPSYYTAPSVIEALALRNRNIINDDEMDALLRRNSLGREQDREWIKRLRFTIPSISDLITMQVREVFDPAIANRLGLYDESPKDIVPYLEAQGLNWSTGVVGNVDGADRTLNWPDMYWGMHWRPFSPEQVFRMWHLLRPERIKRYTDRGLKVEAFDLEQVRLWLRIQDYPPKVRDFLSAIAFQPLRLIDIRNALSTGVAGEAYAREQGIAAPANEEERESYARKWAVQQFLDRGVHPDDAEVQADLALAQKNKSLKAPIASLQRNAQSRFLKAVLAAYRSGITGKANAKKQLTDSGVEDKAADLIIQSIDGEAKVSVIRKTVQFIHDRYLHGEIPDEGLEPELSRAGILDPRKMDYVSAWKMERSQYSRIATTQQIQGWVRDGLMSFPDGMQRLQNLGWSQPDRVLLLADVQQDIVQAQAKQQQSALLAQRRQAKELAALARQQQQELEKTQALLRRASPIKTLQAWLKKGIVNQQFFGERAFAMGYPPLDIERYIQEAFTNGESANGETPPGEATAPTPQ